MYLTLDYTMFLQVVYFSPYSYQLHFLLMFIHFAFSMNIASIWSCYQLNFVFRNALVLLLSQRFFISVFCYFLNNLMVYFLIYFNYSHFTWSSRVFLLKVSKTSFFIWWIYSSFSINLLLYFQKLLTILLSSSLQHENVIGKWSVKKEDRMSKFSTENCLELEI